MKTLNEIRSHVMSLAWKMFRKDGYRMIFDREQGIYVQYSFSFALRSAWNCIKRSLVKDEDWQFSAASYYSKKQSGDYTGD